jgi:uncharacterized membrane protein
MTDANISFVANTIQLAVAPVFLLAGIGGFLNVLASRLARVVDRARALELDILTAGPELQELELAELAILDRRMGMAHWAIGLCTASALLVCLVVIVLFVSDLIGLRFAVPVALLFIAAMAVLTIGLMLFLAEVTVATRSVRVSEKFVVRRSNRRASPKRPKGRRTSVQRPS